MWYIWPLLVILAGALLGKFLGVDSRIKPLMPALKSNWLPVHVITAFLGYAAFGLAFGAAVLYLFTGGKEKGVGSRAGPCWIA
jgi:ABC-type transport system involved in cytochrome c biogenesis permease subunit